MQINIDKKSGIFLGIIAALILVILALLVFRDGDHEGMMDDSHGGMMHSSNSTSLNTSDIMFLQMMIPHHQQAVDISNLAISKSKNQELIKLAKTILSAQSAEIVQMKSWLAAAGAGLDMGHEMHGMSGMLSEVELTELNNASGSNFDRLWLTGMIAHHDGAIDMTKMLEETKDPEIKAFGENVIKVQSAEIAQMKALLSKV
jgi:uncharacterized protein (DUF305 family)